MVNAQNGTPGRRRRNSLDPQAKRITAFIESAIKRWLPIGFVAAVIDEAVRTGVEGLRTDDAFASMVTEDLVRQSLPSAVSRSIRRFVTEHLEALETDDADAIPEAGIRDAREIEELLFGYMTSAYGSHGRIPSLLLGKGAEFAVSLRLASLQALLAHGETPKTAEKTGALRVRLLSGKMQARIEDATTQMN